MAMGEILGVVGRVRGRRIGHWESSAEDKAVRKLFETERILRFDLTRRHCP
jgi:hypothetical protein